MLTKTNFNKPFWIVLNGEIIFSYDLHQLIIPYWEIYCASAKYTIVIIIIYKMK